MDGGACSLVSASVMRDRDLLCCGAAAPPEWAKMPYLTGYIAE